VFLELRAGNFVLFQDVHIHFRPGFTAITGETGSGKSLLVNSLSLLLGRKADPLWIREGSEEAVVEGVFSLDSLPSVRDRLAEMDIDNRGELIVRRIMSRKGKNKIYLNDSPVTLRCLQEVVAGMVEVQGQREGLLLLKPERQRMFLDAFGGFRDTLAEYHRLYERYRSLLKERDEAERTREERLRRIDYLAFQIKEIEEAHLVKGEDEELRGQREWLRQGEALLEALGRAHRLLDGEGVTAAQEVREALGLLSPFSSLGKGLSQEVARLEEALLLIQETAMALEKMEATVEVDPVQLEEVEKRLDLLHRIKTRYGATIEDVLEYLSEAKKELSSLEGMEERQENIEEEILSYKARLMELGVELGRERRRKARELEKEVEKVLHRLLMEGSRFLVTFKELEELGPNGLEEAEFFVQTNPGELSKPLNRVVSGGELSRISLAIRKVLSDIGEAPILVLDEIDVGIGGVTAHNVGKLLEELGQRYQVICVTHLPQVARHAHHQLAVYKEVVDGRSVTMVKELSSGEREREIKRMMGEDSRRGSAG